MGPSRDDYDQYKAEILLGEMFRCEWERQQRYSKGRSSPVAMEEASLGQQSTSQAMAQERMSVHQCTSPGFSASISIVTPGNSDKKSVWPSGGTKKHEECKDVYYGRLCEVVSPERRAQQSATSMRCSQPSLACWSAVTPSNRDPVLPTGGVGGLLLYDHMEESACGDTTDERQHTQMKAMTPATGIGKTVAVYGTEPNKVEVCPAGRSPVQVDLLQCATQSSGEAQGKAQLAAGLKTKKDMGTLYVHGGIQQSAGRAVLGVTK